MWRNYCAVFFAVSGLLFAFHNGTIWAITFLLIGLFPHISHLSSSKSKIILFVHLVIGMMFFFYGTYTNMQHHTNLLGTETMFQGTVKTKPQLTSIERDWSFQLQLRSGEKIQIFYPYAKGSPAPALINDRCTFKGELDKPSSAKNPFSFDYKTYLSNQNIFWLIRVTEEKINCETDDHYWQNVLHKARNRGIDQLVRRDDPETAGLMAALVFGDRSYMNEEKLTQYRELGILHLLAVSGIHVGFVTFALFILLYRIGISREWSSVLVFCFLPLYMFIAGGSPSVLRASLMCMIFLLIVALKWKVKAIDVVAVVALILLVVNPFYIYHLGFQLSFLTSFSLLLSTSFFKDQSHIIILLKVSGVAQLISLPLILYHSFELSLFSLPMNLIFIPFISFWVLPLSFFTVIFQEIFPVISEFSYWLVSNSLLIMDRVLSIASSPSWSVVALGRPSEFMMWLMSMVIAISFLLFENKRKVLAAILPTTVILFQWGLPYVNGNAYVTMLDVGQGDAIIIELPYRKGVYLIDTGGVVRWEENAKELWNSQGPGKYVIEPFLKGKGIAKIDQLILTHGHIDHIGEAYYLSSKVDLQSVLYPNGMPIPEKAKEILEYLEKDGIPVSTVHKGQAWKVNDDWFYILHPEGNEEDENNRSIVLLASLNDVQLLFTGDLEEIGEKQIINSYPNLSFDVLKVAHHGSKYSTIQAFIDHYSFQVGLISAGENNRFGHPHSEVIDRLENKGTTIFRTDQHGAITLTLKRGEYRVSTYISGK